MSVVSIAGQPARDSAGAGEREIGAGQALRLLTRQMFGYPAGGRDGWRPVPDLALAWPAVSEDGCLYRFRLRPGVYWDAQAARPVTAADVVRGVKRLAHDDAAPVRAYFTATVDGLAEYCAAYQEAFGHWQPDAPALAQFQVGHAVRGVTALSGTELEIRLREPAADLCDLLASGHVMAAGREWDYYVPDDPLLHRNSPSAGAYRVDRRRSTMDSLVLEPNPRWDPSTDPIRDTRRGTLRARQGTGEQPDWWFGVLDWTAPGHAEPARYPGAGLCPYLLLPARPGSAAANPVVRQAIHRGVDRTALVLAVTAAGGLGARPRYAVLAAGVPDDAACPSGDPGAARRMLAGAGYPAGLRLTVAVVGAERYRPVLAVLRACLDRCGITLAEAGPGSADILVCEWAPRWAGDARRDLVHRLWSPAGHSLPGGAPPAVAGLARLALRELDERERQRYWAAAEAAARADLTAVPLVTAAWPDTAVAAVAGGGDQLKIAI